MFEFSEFYLILLKRGTNANEGDAIAFLERYNAEFPPLLTKYTNAAWNYETNLTDENANAAVGYF